MPTRDPAPGRPRYCSVGFCDAAPDRDGKAVEAAVVAFANCHTRAPARRTRRFDSEQPVRNDSTRDPGPGRRALGRRPRRPRAGRLGADDDHPVIRHPADRRRDDPGRRLCRRQLQFRRWPHIESRFRRELQPALPPEVRHREQRSRQHDRHEREAVSEAQDRRWFRQPPAHRVSRHPLIPREADQLDRLPRRHDVEPVRR